MDPAPQGGLFRGATHVMPIRVYYENTDAGGIVYHADYLNFAERARTEMMRRFGLAHRDLMEEAGVAFAVQQAHATYRRPARLDDLLMVETEVLEVGGASMRVRQNITRDGELMVAIELRLAMINARGRPDRIPASLRRALQEHLRTHPTGGDAPDARPRHDRPAHV
ncbi:tol-pal system-associated acyl-CoA thioesterase [Roseospira marina]|uniref:Tol-pal system-associated acyl-CoA thioesterase n=2 Tax=Roseospira marina TaxID=140057 RepID=A0A5M6IB45_9PROT|nr:tol-pal system-associated acyl-CoA thioesterase [Roseospira marina]